MNKMNERDAGPLRWVGRDDHGNVIGDWSEDERAAKVFQNVRDTGIRGRVTVSLEPLRVSK